MYSFEKLERHYSSLPSATLHILRSEFIYQEEEFGVHFSEVLQVIDRILALRGETVTVKTNKKILFLCKCGQSRIVEPNVPEDKIKLFIFEQYNVSCPKCKNVNQYTWKYLD